MKDPQDRPDPRQLLEAFLASKRSERAFTALVENLSSLVFSSALRRTGNRPLAEEVTQSVFAILARKAESLRRHPALRAWILETTRLQAASAMRSERRRQRKIAALSSETHAQQSGTPETMDTQASWKEAVPILDQALDRLPANERDIVVQRFYEEKKFREIAAASGLTEGACKKRVKRALEKLSRILSARGVALSTTVIASALGTELARSAPVQSAAVMAPNALAASSSIPATTVIVTTVQTMSTAKTTTLTAATVLAVAALPLSQQVAEGHRLQSNLRAGPPPSASGVAGSKSVRLKRTGERVERKAEGPTASSLLASLDAPAESRALLTSLMKPYSTGSLERQMAWLRISRMTPEEHAKLLKDLETYPFLSGMEGLSKDLVASSIRKYGPKLTPQERMDRMIASGKASFSSVMRGWAADEPDAALTWYEAKLASGALFPGLTDDLHERVLTDLIVGLGFSRPEKAFEIYQNTPRKEIYELTPDWLAGAFAAGMLETGDDTHLVRLLDAHSGKDRNRILSSALGEYADKGMFDEGLAFVDAHNDDPAARFGAIKSMTGRFGGYGKPDYFPAGQNFVLANTSEAEAAQLMDTLVGGIFSEDQARKWLAGQSPGVARDQGFASLSGRRSMNGDFAEAMAELDSIQDTALRAATRDSVARRWLENDPEAAADALPADLLEQLQNK